MINLAVLDTLPADAPMVMLILLRFRAQADYPDPRDACSGREAFGRYTQTSRQTVAAVGGRVVFSGQANPPVIGVAGETWDLVLLVQYPSVAAFRTMLAMPEYQACVHHRTAALADARLVPLAPFQFPDAT